MRQEGPAKLDIQIKSVWLLICLTFVAKSPGFQNKVKISTYKSISSVSLTLRNSDPALRYTLF